MALAQITYTRDYRLHHFAVQLMALGFVVPLWSLWIYAYYPQAGVRTLLLLAISSVIGIVLINRVSKSLADPRISFLGWVYILKITLVLWLVFQYWAPYLDVTSGTWGYDPQRFYDGAVSLAQYGFEAAPGQSITNVGITYYYGVQMYLFGANPVVVALCNALISLASTLLVITIVGRINLDGKVSLLLGAALILVPETVWYEVMTARAGIVTPALVLTILSFSCLLSGYMGKGLSRWWLILAIPALLILGITRPVILIAAGSSIALISLIVDHPTKKWAITLMLLALTLPIVLMVPWFARQLADSTFAYTDYIVRATGNYGELSHLWTESSIGRLLVPSNLLESIVYVPLRAVAHLVAPLPNYYINWSHSLYIQSITHLISSVLYVLILPRSLASLVLSIFDVRYRAFLMFHIPLWVTLAAVAWGQPYIHERYRLMAVPFLLASCFVGNIPKRLLLASYVFCYVTFAVAVLGYVIYKLYWMYI